MTISLLFLMSLLLIKDVRQFNEVVMFLTSSANFSIVPKIKIELKLLSHKLESARSELE